MPFCVTDIGLKTEDNSAEKERERERGSIYRYLKRVEKYIHTF